MVNREKWIDNAKGIGILFVVLGHSIGYAGGENLAAGL
jgi:fucose 4-O-acetylase-like acetyltransferase